MNTDKKIQAGAGSKLVLMLTLALFVSACASTQPSPQGSAEVRSKLTALQNDPHLGDRARVEMREAEEAVRLAEVVVPSNQTELGEQRVYMAERKVAIAEAKASTQLAESQRTQLSTERDAARLKARTQEADRAHSDAAIARSETDRISKEQSAAATATAQSRSDSEKQEADLQKRIDELEARPSDRGLVLTLGDVLFATGSAELRSGDNSQLDKLVTFLDQYPERTALIEGHTDNVGAASYNQQLSQHRAETVRDYLIQKGVAANRLSASGMGLHKPVASNNDATGRQQNRRVEIIIEDSETT